MPYLACTKCGKEFPLETLETRCSSCGEPLEVRYELTSPELHRSDFLLEKYRDFLPFPKPNKALSLGEGFTPLLKLHRIGESLKVDLYVKNETVNPTWSFKDRGTLCGVQYAVDRGYSKIGTVSTGNMGASIAAYGARAGLRTYVLVSSTIEEEKVLPISVYGANVVKVEGDYGMLYYESLRIGAERGICFVNSDHPMRVEGSKTIGFEICEQFSFKTPDWVIVPVSSGGNFRGVVKGFKEFREAGLIERLPKFVVAQASGCCPIVRAFEEGKEEVKHFGTPNTIAHAISNPFPPSGNEVIRILRELGGVAVTVEDEEILRAQLTLAREGIFAQPAGAVPIAALHKLVSRGLVERGESVVCLITGAGLKYLKSLEGAPLSITSVALEDLGSAL
ncbi:MAG: threonine synthase [Thermoproteota archaeon]|nr:MAG: threonine synthase [Candidatus Korarchaeota archaeon]